MGQVLRVTRFGEPVLREVGRPVTVFDATLRKLAEDMVETMYEAEGIGLAAQQVGVALQLCVVDLQLGRRRPDFDWAVDGRRIPLDLLFPLALVNPVIDPPGKDAETEPFEEGCLSFPEIRGDVVRPVAITVRYRDLEGHPHELRADGLLARVIQHEVDHLNGVLFIDRMAPSVRRSVAEPVKVLEETTRATLARPPSP